MTTIPPDQLAATLRAAGIKDVDTASRRRAEYSSDASNYRAVPLVVAFPRDADEMEAAVKVCGNLGVPLVPRGAGTSIAGNAIGAGVVLDTSRHLHHVLHVDPDRRTAVVEPGTVLDDITRAASPYGLRFGPDPSTHSRATIGGSIGNNACGSRALRYGRTADNVVDLDVLAGTGARFTARRYGGAAAALGETAGTPQARLVSDLIALTSARLAMIRTEFGRFTRQVSGYSLEHLLPENGTDLARFLVGTEGSLALTLKATVRLVTAPKATALTVLAYGDMAEAAEAVPGLLPLRPVALEGLDARLVEVVRARRGPAAVPGILPDGGGWLFTETAGDTLDEAVDAGRRLAKAAACRDAAVVTGPQAAALWRIREDGAGLGGRTPANAPAWPGWEDSAVPPENLPAYLRELQALLRQYKLDGLMYGHFGDGCVHVRIDFPLRDRASVLREFTEDAARLAARHGGSASGEHGDGRARGELLRYMYSQQALDTFAQVKRIFDPRNTLNPGIIADPAALDAGLRVPAARPMREGLGFAYSRDGGDFTTAVHRCVGVGKCRADNTAAGGVMCPSFLATRDEKDSTRGRARVLQELANGSLVTGWDAAEISEALDLCLSCKGCSTDCPAGVDMATYKAEALYQRYKGRRRPASHYSLGWLPRWAALATRMPGLANAALAVGPGAVLARRLGGIDQRRDLPRFAPRGFRRWLRGHQRRQGRAVPAGGPPEGPGRPVLLWADTFTNAFAPQVGQAAVRVLEQAGYAPFTTRRAACCGLTWISTGQLDGARRQLRRALDQLGPALDAGIPIVGLEPSCTAALRGDAAELLPDDPRAAMLATAVKSLAELLGETDGWTPPDLSDVTGVAQPHCHHRAAGSWESDAALLRAAGATISAVGGCCGLAGNFGVERGHHDVSVKVAETALLPAVREARRADPGATVLADGFSCRTQLSQLAGVPGTHLAELLAARLGR